MTTTTALLVEGAFLLADDALPKGRRDDVVNSVLLARHTAASSGDAGYAGALTEVLNNIGWTTTSANERDVRLEGSLCKGPVPLAVIAQDLAGLLPSRLVGELVAGVDALAEAAPDVRKAWDTTAHEPGAQAALLIVATLDGDLPRLVYDHAVLSPAKPSKGYPWTRLKGPGTLTQHYGAMVLNPTVFTAEVSARLATRVAPLLPAAVIPV